MIGIKRFDRQRIFWLIIRGLVRVIRLLKLLGLGNVLQSLRGIIMFRIRKILWSVIMRISICTLCTITVVNMNLFVCFLVSFVDVQWFFRSQKIKWRRFRALTIVNLVDVDFSQVVGQVITIIKSTHILTIVCI